MPKLFVIQAADAPIAAILRRGPSTWYHLIRWDLEHDQFMHGAWIRGRIYDEKCDVSPDGNLFVYSVFQGSRTNTEFTHCWTAVSRLPWLHALVVWPQATTYGGGGRFVGRRELALQGARSPLHDGLANSGLTLVDAPADLHDSSDEVAGADWSGRDYRNRLIYTRGGQLFRQEGKTELLLADFTALVPEPQPSPEWARRPL